MSVPTSAAMALPRTLHATDPAERMCSQASGAGADSVSSIAVLFPPRDADADTRRAWLADSPWPEVVFASAH
ncbi:MAG: hypothetical protein ABR500_14975 [Dermatophilaceae bacterium]|nr:hypothetical protein [Intrasporangiaceae bacterium]